MLITKIFEGLIKDDKEFTKWATDMLKSGHGDKYDQKKADKVIKDLLAKYKEDYGAAIGALQSGFGE